jgi:hypothetical protein
MYESNVAVLGAVITAPAIAEEAGLDLAYTGSNTVNMILWAVAAMVAGVILLRAARPVLVPASPVHAEV